LRTAHLYSSLLIFLAASGLAGVAARSLLAADDSPNAAAPLGGADSGPTPEHPAGWRGDGSGQYALAKPPTKWSAKENVLWKTEVGAGASSPVLVGSRVFITAEPDLLICVDADTGKELWRQANKLSDFPAALKAKADMRPNQYGDASPAAVSDGKWIWVYYGTGVVACYDLDGKSRWIDWFNFRRTTQEARTASPILVGQRLLLHFGPLVCLDATTGKVLWKNDSAKATYGTPAQARIGDVDVVITPGGHVVRVADGKLLASDLGHCMYTSPVVQGRMVYFIDRSISAVELPEKAGDQVEGKELWYEDLSGDFFASPIVHGGRIYAVNRSADFYVIDAGTGKTLSKNALKLPPAGRSESPNIYPSLCLAGKHLFVNNDAGETELLEPGDKGTAVGLNSLPAGSGSTPIFADRRMFIRGGKLLYCVGER
jgi:outer membrane protein assembly factor BamB